jgi:hypothetical protein
MEHVKTTILPTAIGLILLAVCVAVLIYLWRDIIAEIIDDSKAEISASEETGVICRTESEG